MRNALLAGTGVLALATWTAAEAAPILPGSFFGPVPSAARNQEPSDFGTYELASSWDGTNATEVFEWAFSFRLPRPFTTYRLLYIDEPFQSNSGQLPPGAFFDFLRPDGSNLFDSGAFPLLSAGTYTARWTFENLTDAGTFNRAYRFEYEVVPLPAAAPLLVVALGGLGLAARHRRQPA